MLGNLWLRGVGKVVHDYHKMTMEFRPGSKKRVWTTLITKEVKSCEAIMFEKLCKGGTHCFAIVLAKLESVFEVEKIEERSAQDDLSLMPVDIQEVLMDHWGGSRGAYYIATY